MKKKFSKPRFLNADNTPSLEHRDFQKPGLQVFLGPLVILSCHSAGTLRQVAFLTKEYSFR